MLEAFIAVISPAMGSRWSFLYKIGPSLVTLPVEGQIFIYQYISWELEGVVSGLS